MNVIMPDIQAYIDELVQQLVDLSARAASIARDRARLQNENKLLSMKLAELESRCSDSPSNKVSAGVENV